jgi:RNA-binding protein YlmH
MSYLSHIQDEGVRLLLSRLDDLVQKSGRGEAAVSPYLTPREAKYARIHLSSRLSAGTAVLWGGYPEAERVRAVVLPEYTEGLVDVTALVSDPVAALRDGGLDDLAETVRCAVCPVLVKGSGFRELSHRDYLGSVLGLGLERDAIGDILIPDTHSAILLTDSRVGDFLTTQMEKVATDTVRVSRLPEGTSLAGTRRLQPVNDTVASERLDCVVAALCNLSREKAQMAVRSGIVELDYEAVEDCSATVDAPAVISVRGYGKFAVHAFDGTTRKGRIRLVAGKYI